MSEIPSSVNQNREFKETQGSVSACSRGGQGRSGFCSPSGSTASAVVAFGGSWGINLRNAGARRSCPSWVCRLESARSSRDQARLQMLQLRVNNALGIDKSPPPRQISRKFPTGANGNRAFWPGATVWYAKQCFRYRARSTGGITGSLPAPASPGWPTPGDQATFCRCRCSSAKQPSTKGRAGA